MLKIDFNNTSKSPIKKSFLEKIARDTIARSGILDLQKNRQVQVYNLNRRFDRQSKIYKTCEAGQRPASARNARKYNISLSFADVSEEEIKRLNKTYRKKNAPTDVLSFPEHEGRGAIYRALKSHNTLFLGEIVLCYNDIAKYCKKNKLVLRQELSKVVAHGVLHLLGFRHGKKMFRIQNH